jgi:hypothetical protein
MKEVKAEVLDNHKTDLVIGDQPVTIGGKYNFTLRPLTWGMFQLAQKEEDVALAYVRYSIVATDGTTAEFGIEFEEKDFCGEKYKVATAEPLRQVPMSITGALARVVDSISKITALDSVQIDFMPAAR